MQKTKALNWLFPENVRRVEKQSTKTGRFLLGYMLRNFQRGPWSLSTPCVCQLPSSWPCHGRDSSHWLPANLPLGKLAHLGDQGQRPTASNQAWDRARAGKSCCERTTPRQKGGRTSNKESISPSPKDSFPLTPSSFESDLTYLEV